MEKSKWWNEMALLIFAGKGIQFGAFKLKMHEKYPDAPLSPIYVNLRRAPKGPFDPKTLAQIGKYLGYTMVEYSITAQKIIGIPEAGVPLAQSAFEVLRHTRPDLSILELNKEVSAEGRRIGSQLTGEFKTGELAVPIDDLITAADTKLEAVESLRNNGLVVNDCVVLVDREQGGKQQLENAGVRLQAVATLTQLLNFYESVGLIAPETIQEIHAYRGRVDEFMAAQKQ